MNFYLYSQPHKIHANQLEYAALSGRLAAVHAPSSGAYKSGFCPEFPALHHTQIF